MKYILLIGILVVIHHLVQTQYTEQEDTNNYLHFALNSYKIIHDVNTNFAYSPLALRVIYSILYQISTGNAESKLHEILLPTTPLRTSKYDILQNQVDSLSQILRKPGIRLVNKFYVNNSTAFDKLFKYLTERYQTEYELIDLSRTEQTRSVINKWAETRTNGQIVNVVQDAQIQPNTNMIIINSIHFQAEWLRKYSENQIQDGLFNSIHGSRIPVKFITDTQTYDISFRPLLGLYALRLPYKTGFEFWIILPFANYPFANFAQSITANIVYDIKQNFQRTYSQIKFPVFTIESSVNGNAVKPDAFQNQDFQYKTGTQQSVGGIIQKTKFSVNNDGTEAASGIYTVPASTSRILPSELFYFIADRPFMYAVITDGNIPIILGHYTS